MQKHTQLSTFIGISEIVEIELVYTRPTRRGREIFGALVPYGHAWRTGSDGNTMISFSHDIALSGHSLKKGKYALFTVPGPETWKVIFYNHTGNYGLPRPMYQEDLAAMFDIPATKISNIVDVFTIDIVEKRPGVADIEISWENTKVSIPIDFSGGTPFEPERGANGGVTLNDYYNSAKFHFEEIGNTDHALWSLNALLEMNVTYFYLALKSQVLAHTGDLTGAIQTANDSLMLAEQYGNEKYIRLNKANLAQWEQAQLG